jgi:hypothetical protein
MLKPLFYTRGFLLNPFQNETLAVSSARWSAIGGPETATLHGPASENLDLSRAISLLRCPVDLVDDANSMPAWWGYVSAIELRQAHLVTRVDLEKMFNRVKVQYTDLPTESNQWYIQRLETAWLDDLNSQVMYGVKEKIIQLHSSTPIQALATAALDLAAASYPQAQPNLASNDLPRSSDRGAAEIVLELRGWWNTLGWRYYSQPAGLIENLYEGPGAQSLGSSSTDESVYQGITVDVGGLVVSVCWVKSSKVGSPANDLQLDICADSTGNPGSSIASATIPAASFTTSFVWLPFQFSSPVALAAGSYWLWLHRTGATHGSNYYRLKVDQYASYPGGVAWMNGAPISPECDLLFRVAGGTETTVQISDIAAAAAGGQFLNGIRLDVASGIYTNPFRQGNVTAQAEILALLDAGDSNGVKMQAEITQDRFLRVYSQPAAAAANLFVNSEGALVNSAGDLVPLWTPAAGRWAVVSSAWGNAGSPYQHVKDRVLLNFVEYDPESGGLRVG